MRGAFYLSALLTAAAPLPAQEAREAVDLPGLESDTPNTALPESCSVNLSGGTVSVAVSVRSVSDRPALLLSGPLFGWKGPADPYPDRHFPELQISVDGALIVPEDRFEAFMGNRNITNMLELASLDPWIITRTPPVTAAPPQKTPALKALMNIHAVEKSGDGYRANWSARRLIRIPLNSVPVQRVELRYRLRPATAVLSVAQLDTTSREKLYCISPEQLRHLPRAAAGPSGFAVDEFSIPTGIDGTAPTAVTFSMSASPAAAAAPILVFLCGPHGKPIAKKGAIADTRVEVDDAGLIHVLSVARPVPR